MFSDPTIRWRPYPSILDGIERPPFVDDYGMWKGILKLLIVGARETRAYGIEIDCEVYVGVEEMIYSIFSGPVKENGSAYDGNVYLKEASNSSLIEAFEKVDPFNRKMRHFLFVGGDFCYETIGLEAPVIHQFESPEEGYSWGANKAAD